MNHCFLQSKKTVVHFELNPEKETGKESTSCEKIAQEVLLCQEEKEVCIMGWR